MPKKKQPRNAFFFFMLDYKARCERNGERFPNGLRDVQIEAGPEWDVLPAAEKKHYEDLAKEEKARIRGDGGRKETCLHNTFDSIDRQKLEEEEYKNTMVKYIEGTVSSLSTRKLLAEHKFYLIHVNYFCISEGECYHPAELALSEFSLLHGVTNTYHTIIDPGPIPLGYRFEATQKSDATHKIPLEENPGERDFNKILRNIKAFLEPGRNANGGQYPPMFTMPDNVHLNTSTSAVKSVIETLCGSELGYENYEKYPIYNLEKLFEELRSKCSAILEGQPNSKKDQTNVYVTRSELERDVFNYTQHIACKFHQNEDAVAYCSKSYAVRWVYLICDHLCQYLDIDMVPGQHVPENTDVFYSQKKLEEDKKREVTPKPITWIDHSQNQQATSSGWVPRQQEPLPRPQIRANLAAMLPKRPDPAPIDISEENFPSMPVGRGRGRVAHAPRGKGNAPASFADAMKYKK